MRDTVRLTTDRSDMSNLKPAVKGLLIAAAILAVVGAGAIAARQTGILDRISRNMQAADQPAQTPGPGSIPEGTWTVGTDIQPGTYSPVKAVAAGAGCYWVIYKSGSNTREILANELLDAGGRPTVTLEVGQDFSSHDCGTWIKQ